MKSLIEQGQVAAGFVPVNLATAANAGDWVSLKHYGHVAIVFFKAAGAAGEDPTITVEQATAVAGTGNKALNFTTIHVKQGADLAAIGQFTKVTQSAGNTYTHTDAAEAQAIWVIEFDAADLDVANGYDCVQASVGDVGATAQVGALLYILSRPRFTPPPSAIVD